MLAIQAQSYLDKVKSMILTVHALDALIGFRIARISRAGPP